MWMVGLFVFIFVIAWAGALGFMARFMEQLANPYPSATAFRVLRRHIRKMRADKPNEITIDAAIELKIVLFGRDIEIHSFDRKIALGEDHAKLLTLDLLTVYPELEDTNYVPVIERHRSTDVEYYFQSKDGGPVWC